MPKGPKVTSKDQAKAIAASEARKANKRKKSKKAEREKFAAVMREFAAGQLRSGRK